MVYPIAQDDHNYEERTCFKVFNRFSSPVQPLTIQLILLAVIATTECRPRINVDLRTQNKCQNYGGFLCVIR